MFEMFHEVAATQSRRHDAIATAQRERERKRVAKKYEKFHTFVKSRLLVRV